MANLSGTDGMTLPPSEMEDVHIHKEYKKL